MPLDPMKSTAANQRASPVAMAMRWVRVRAKIQTRVMETMAAPAESSAVDMRSKFMVYSVSVVRVFRGRMGVDGRRGLRRRCSGLSAIGGEA